MTKKIPILPLASALGALAVTAIPTEAPAALPGGEHQAQTGNDGQAANMIVSTGEALLGFVTTNKPDGTVVAQHVSHASHASHTSHASSRF